MDGSTTVEIREGTRADVDAVVDLWVDLAADQRRHGSHLRADANRTAVRETIARRVVRDELLVAIGTAISETDDGDATPLGFVMFSIERGVYEQDLTRGIIDAVFVRPANRDFGIGSRLLDAAETRLSNRGVDVVALEALADNDDARRFYRERGYDPRRIEFEKPIDSNGTK
ncbi:GNAT family N-acetyltransferase [Halopenitus salinus]|uniref:GNAT family N-acetyltransferase n=1 Tax=Halopenitus salinus TaxID=1198295 RepID=A0ABD5UR85_9EURY